MRVSNTKMRVAVQQQAIRKDVGGRRKGTARTLRASCVQKSGSDGVRPAVGGRRKTTPSGPAAGQTHRKEKGSKWIDTAMVFSAMSLMTPGMAWADIDAQTAKLLASVLQPTLALSSVLMIVRIPMTWYPNIDGTKWPWNLVYIPTEPILGPTRKVIQPVGGVDISPIVWVALLSFLNEILLGPQGILNLLQMKV